MESATATVVAVEKELLAATKLSKKPGEDPQKYRIRLLNQVGTLPEATWKEFSLPTQQWYNDAVTALEAKTEIPGFPEGASTAGEETVVATEEETDGDATETKEAKKARKEAEKAAKKAAKEAEKASKKAAKKTRGTGAVAFLRKYYLQNPEASPEDGVAASATAGHTIKAGTASTTKHKMRWVLATLKELGKLKD